MVGWSSDPMDMNLSKLWELVMDREACRAAVHGLAKSRTRLSDYTAIGTTPPSPISLHLGLLYREDWEWFLERNPMFSSPPSFSVRSHWDAGVGSSRGPQERSSSVRAEALAGRMSNPLPRVLCGCNL